jgi:phospholipase C
MADDPIEHVVLLMLENRSFDHILGGTQKMLARWSLSGTNQHNGNNLSANVWGGPTSSPTIPSTRRRTS